jgi:hypothetical protein
MPASSPGVLLDHLDLVAVRSAQRTYMRSSIWPSPGSRCRRRRRGPPDRRRWRRPRPTAASRARAWRPRRAAPAAPLGLRDDGRIALGLAQLDQLDIVLGRALQPLDRRNPAVEVLALAHHASGRLGVVPQVRILGAAFSSARRLRRCPSQRCLLSSPTDCLISSTLSLSGRYMRLPGRCCG